MVKSTTWLPPSSAAVVTLAVVVLIEQCAGANDVARDQQTEQGARARNLVVRAAVFNRRGEIQTRDAVGSRDVADVDIDFLVRRVRRQNTCVPTTKMPSARARLAKPKLATMARERITLRCIEIAP